jgi:hypothetical protein
MTNIKFNLDTSPNAQAYSSMELPNLGEMINDAVSPEIQTISTVAIAVFASWMLVNAFRR